VTKRVGTRERKARQLLVAHLEKMRAAWATPGLAYRGPADFVLQHGRWFRLLPYPAGYPSLPPKVCYGNSIAMASGYFPHTGLRYVEGFALFPCVVAYNLNSKSPLVLPDPAQAMPVSHAWNTDAQGRLIDATWCNGALAYRGVEFSLERADDCCWNGDGCVLDDRHRGWPLLRERWQGEPAGLVWPRSPRLEALRRFSASPEARQRAKSITRKELWEILNAS
jgi:hypothetical protein